MDMEYKIKFSVPKGYDPSALLNKLPSPIHRARISEIYNYRIDSDGFYFIDRRVDERVASVAFKRFVDEALSHGDSVQMNIIPAFSNTPPAGR